MSSFHGPEFIDLFVCIWIYAFTVSGGLFISNGMFVVKLSGKYNMATCIFTRRM
jgi:hypothetical protein